MEVISVKELEKYQSENPENAYKVKVLIYMQKLSGHKKSKEFNTKYH